MLRLLKICICCTALLLLVNCAWSNDSLKITQVGVLDIPDMVDGITIIGHYAYVMGYQNVSVCIVDISIPSAPTIVGYMDTPGYYTPKIVVQGNYAYLADWEGGLQIWDVSNPAAPIVVGTYDTPDAAAGVAVRGDYAYVADYYTGLVIINISNPAAPTLTGTCNTPGWAYDVEVSGNYAYVADAYYGLQIIRISNPASPVITGTYNTPGMAGAVSIVGNYAYVADDASGLRIINVSNPAAPTSAAVYDTPGNAIHVIVRGDYAYVSDSGWGLRIIKISNLSALTEVGFYAVNNHFAKGSGISGNYAFVAEGIDLHVFDFSVAIDAILPVQFLGLAAVPGDSRVTLNWRTASEQNNARFEIARDGELVASQAGQGSSASAHDYSWTDRGLVNGRSYRYTLSSVSANDEREELQSIQATPTAEGLTVVTAYALHEAYPNPFNPTTTISYDLKEAGLVKLAVFNLLGQNVATLVSSLQSAGQHSVTFDATGLPSGAYLYRIETNGFSATRKMLLMK
jgi:hypothetical protein